MAIFLNTTGQPTLGIGICGRCSKKFPLADLSPDRNSPGLMVCDADNDQLDPYRLPARQPDNLILPFYRPDEPLTVPLVAAQTNFRITEDESRRITQEEDPRITQS